MIVKCVCDNYLGNKAAASYQDMVYGKNNRAHNPIRKEPLGQHWRCTICGTEHSKSEDKKK